MNKDRVDSIRAAMAGFQLPASAIPSWASNMSEDEWKHKVSSVLHPKKRYQQMSRILPVSSPSNNCRFKGSNLMLVRLPFRISDLTLLDENGESAVNPRRIAIRLPVLPVISCCPSSLTATQWTGSWVPGRRHWFLPSVLFQTLTT